MSVIHRLLRLPTKHQLIIGTPRRFNSESVSDSSTSSASSSTNSDVPGLSPKVLKVPTEAVGPGASKNNQYKNPEYFCYHVTSYFDAELEMLKFRLPQPSSEANKS